MNEKQEVTDTDFKPTQIGVKNTHHQLTKALQAIGETEYTTFPTEEGGLKLYWTQRTDMLTIEIEPDTFALYAHSVNLTEGTYTEHNFSTVNQHELKMLF